MMIRPQALACIAAIKHDVAAFVRKHAAIPSPIPELLPVTSARFPRSRRRYTSPVHFVQI
jgi:hypothetical protein